MGRYGRVLLVLLGMVWASSVLAATEYSIGIVPQFRGTTLYSIWKPILTELEKRTDLKFRVVASSSIPVFETKLDHGEFDFVYSNPYHFIVGRQAQGYVPLARDHGRELKGIVVVKKGGDIGSVQDLQGKAIAFPSPNALGASLLVRSELSHDHHIEFEPVYVKTHTNVYINVSRGMTAAGGGVERTLNSQGAELRDTLRVLYTTRGVAPHPISAHPRVPEEHRQRVADALLSLGDDPRTQALLEKIPMKQIGVATVDDYKALAQFKIGDMD